MEDNYVSKERTGINGAEHGTNIAHPQQQQHQQQQKQQHRNRRRRRTRPRKQDGTEGRSKDSNQQPGTCGDIRGTGMPSGEKGDGDGDIGRADGFDGNDDGIDDGASNEASEAEEKRTASLQESFERASADLEMICAAYPDEVTLFQTSNQESTTVIQDDDDDDGRAAVPSWFPLMFTLALPSLSTTTTTGANVTMELPRGYPTTATLQIVSYRGVPPSSSAVTKVYVEAAVIAVRCAAEEALHINGGDGDGEECALACCAAAFDSWRISSERFEIDVGRDDSAAATACNYTTQDDTIHGDHIDGGDDDDIHWITSDNTVVDRKSVFQAHVCPIDSEDMVRRAVDSLIRGSSKIQRASHNMVRSDYMHLSFGRHVYFIRYH